MLICKINKWQSVGANEQNSNSLDLLLRMRTRFTTYECGPAPALTIIACFFSTTTSVGYTVFWFTEKKYCILNSSHTVVSAMSVVLVCFAALRASVTLVICLLLTQFIIIHYLLSSDSFSNASLTAASSPLLLFIVSILLSTPCSCVK